MAIAATAQVQEYGGPVAASVGLHALVILLLAGNLSFCGERSADVVVPAHVRAVVLDRAPPAPRPETRTRVQIPEVRIAPPEPVPLPVLPEPAPRVPGLKSAEPAKKTPARSNPADFAAALEREDRERALRELARRAAEDAVRRVTAPPVTAPAAGKAQPSRAEQQAIDDFRAQIAAEIRNKWRRPASARNGMVAEFRIELVPGGELRNVVLTRSSGDAAFDRAAENAIRLAAPLPVPGDPALFNSAFRQFTFRFRPEDLAQ